MRFINPKTDFAFKKIFGSPQSKEILISFLNAIIYEAEPVIEDLEILDPYQSPPLASLKDTYLDVKARLRDGSLVIIEMQMLSVESFGKRILYNASKAYSIQLESGESYWTLKPVIALTIVNFIMFPQSEAVISHYVFKEEKTNLKYIENDLDLIFVELPKFNKESDVLETLTEKWIYFVKKAEKLNSIPEKMQNITPIEKAFEIANRANLTPEELEDLEKRQRFLYDQEGSIIKAKNEGIAEGIETGKQEKALEIARQLLKVLDDETISKTTGLSVEEVIKLRQS
jgi:predicted transposase/invertase (TIGR01784 family)